MQYKKIHDNTITYKRNITRLDQITQHMTIQFNIIHDNTRRDDIRQYMAIGDNIKQHKAIEDNRFQCKPRQDKTSQDKPIQDKTRQDKTT